MAFEFIERSPCATCPYRQDAKLALWDPQYFVDLLRHDRQPTATRSTRASRPCAAPT